MRTYLFLATLTVVILLFLLEGCIYLPLVQDNYGLINQAGLQRTRVEVFTKSALILAYRPLAEHAQAISDMQTALPFFEQEQNTLFASNEARYESDTQILLDQTRPDYLAIVAVVESILARPNSPVDPVEVNILLVHDTSYRATMNEVVTALQQHLDAATFHLFIFESVLLGLVLIIILPGYIFVIRPKFKKRKEVIAS